MEKYSETFVEVADFLTDDNWVRTNFSTAIYGKFFVIKDGKLCFSVYGAVKARLVPAIISSLDGAEEGGVSMAVIVSRMDYIASYWGGNIKSPDHGDACMQPCGNIPHTAWQCREQWSNIDTDIFIGGFNCGNRQALFILGMAGLTPKFHDDPTTTLDMVKVKLLVAGTIAKHLGF